VSDGPTCGQGLAQNSVVPLKAGELIGALADNLEMHLPALDLSDERSAAEQGAYLSLIEQYRDIARRLAAAGEEMAGYRDLPMGRHDMEAMSRPEVGRAFADFVAREEELLALLERGLERDRAMLDAMRP
jgi:hypothetical protein